MTRTRLWLGLVAAVVMAAVGTLYATGTGFWLSSDGGVYTLRIGLETGPRLLWDGKALSLYDAALDLNDGDVVLDTDGLTLAADDGNYLQWGDGNALIRYDSSTGRLLLYSTGASGTVKLWSGKSSNAFTVDGDAIYIDGGTTPQLGYPGIPFTTLYVDPGTTTDASYPAVVESAQLKAKTDGANNSYCGSSEFVNAIDVERGIVTAVSCATPSTSTAALQAQLAVLRAELDALRAELSTLRAR